MKYRSQMPPPLGAQVGTEIPLVLGDGRVIGKAKIVSVDKSGQFAIIEAEVTDPQAEREIAAAMRLNGASVDVRRP